MTLWSSPHPKESAALSLGHAQQGTEVSSKIKELTAAPPGSTMPIMPASVTSFSSDGSEDAGFEEGNIDVDMADGEEETDGIQIGCIQTLTEFEPIADGGDPQETNGSPVMADCKTAIPLPAPPVQIGSAYGGNQAYSSFQNSLPRLMDRPTSPLFYGSNTISETRHRARGDVGLNNIGNTCFMNSGLQCLLHTSPLVEFFVNSETFDRRITSLVYQFHSLMSHAWFGYANTIALHDFKMVLGNKYAQFKDTRQHDCQEFLAVLLDVLHEELKLKNKSPSTAADSSVSESYVEECTGSDKNSNSTKAHSSSSTTHTVTEEKGSLGTVSGSPDGKDCPVEKKRDTPSSGNPVYKRLKLESSSKTEMNSDSTIPENDIEDCSSEVKRKTAVVKPENRVQPDSVARCSVDTEEELVDVENIENEAEVHSQPAEDSLDENRVICPPTQKAQEYWDKYMQENNTVVASTFQGMFKSSVTCSECSFVSETYEPFMYLSLPIPRVMEKQLNATFISMKDRNPIKVDLMFHLMGTMDKLIQEVVSKVDSCIWDDSAKYAVAEVFNHRVSRVLDDKAQMRALNTSSRNIYVYELNDNFQFKYGTNNESSDCSSVASYPYYGTAFQPCSSSDSRLKTKTVKLEDWMPDDNCATATSDVTASTSTSTYEPVRAPVGGGVYDTSAASSSFSPGVSSSSDDPTQQQDNNNFNKVQCNICLEDYPRNDLKQHRGCSCVLCEECLMKSVEHFQTDEGQPKGDSYVKCAVCLKTVECKKAFVSLEELASLSSPSEFITMPILFRNEPGTDANNNSSWNSGLFASPWLIRVPSHVNAMELVEYLESINPVPEADHRLLSVKSDGKNCGQCVFSTRCGGCELPREGMISLNCNNSIMISYTGLPSERIAEVQPSDMAIHNELSTSWNYSRNDEPAIDIHDCLRTFSETEHLDEQNPWYCPKCEKNQRATKALSICKFPDYLIVYLKRFVFLDQSSNKLNNRLTFPINDLDVSDYVTEGFSTDVGKYNLYSCVCHFGSASVGHYTAYAKNPLTGQWHYFNDDTITERAPADNEHASAYVLFYEKQGMRCGIPPKYARPLPELNSFNTSSSTYSADTRGSYLPSECSVSAAGPVRADGDFMGDMNLQVDSTSPSFTFPHTSTEADLLALEVDEVVGNENETAQLSEIRDGLGLVENDSTAVTSSTSTHDDHGLLDFNDVECGSNTNTDDTGEAAPSSTTTQHNELSSSSAVGGADSTSNE